MPERDGRRDVIGALGALALLSQVGLVIVLPIVGGIFLGRFLDGLLGTRALFLAVFLLLGLIGGGGAAIGLLLREVNRGNSNRGEKP